MKAGENQRSQFTEISFMLRAKSWRKWLPELDYKFMLAAALNEVLYETGPVYKKFVIIGYLITGSRIYLVCKLRFVSVESVLDLFFEKIKAALQHQKKRRPKEKKCDGEEYFDEFPVVESMFDIFPFPNEWLKQLLTGHAVHLRYYEPRLARIKDRIEHEMFCSVTDYAGGEGPVVVSKESHERRNQSLAPYRKGAVKRKKL